MPFVQRVIEPKYLSRTSLWNEDGKPRVTDDELQAVTNNTLSNALRQLASLVLVANDIFTELSGQLHSINKRSDELKAKIQIVEDRVAAYDPKKVTVPESDICTFALLKNHYASKYNTEENLFVASTRPKAVQALYESAAKTPVHLMRQMDRWRRDGHRSSRFFMCTPILGQKRRRIREKINIDIETSLPAVVNDLRRWTSSEALGDITVTPDCPTRITPNVTLADGGEVANGTVASDDEGIDHKLPSPEEQLQVVALKFPAEVVAVDVSGRSFDRMSVQRRSLLHGDIVQTENGSINVLKRTTRTRKPRSRRRNTIAGTDQNEIKHALNAGEEPCTSANNLDTESSAIGPVCRSKSSDLLRSVSKRDSPEIIKKSHFNSLKQWSKNRYDRFMNRSCENKSEAKKTDIDDFNVYETITMKRKRNIDKERKTHERNPSISSSEKSSVNLAISGHISSVMNIAVKLRESSAQRRQRRSRENKDEQPHSSSGNWSASSESGRASIGSEFTSSTAQPKSITSTETSNNSLNQQAPNSVNSRRRFNFNTSTSSSITSEGTLTPDIIHDLHEDGETSSVYSCDTEGYYTSFHMDSGLKTLKEEELPCTPLHSTSAFSTSASNCTVLTAENEYELFGKGSTSTTTSSAGTVCTTLRASDSNRSLNGCPTVPERKSSLSNFSNKINSPESSLERDGDSDKTGTVKRSPATVNKSGVVSKQTDGDVSPDSGHNTSSSPIESINSPIGLRSGSEFEFSESSDMEGSERNERIRMKTTINSSRIPSMCAITPPLSDDDSIKSCSSMNNFNRFNLHQMNQIFNSDRNKLELNLKTSEPDESNLQSRIIATNVNGTSKLQLINVNPQSGYATVENIDEIKEDLDINKNSKTLRAPSPSGGSVIINQPSINKTSSQPIIKATLMPINNMFGKLKTNLANFAHKRESKSPNRNNITSDELSDAGDYVTLADVRNNNNNSNQTVAVQEQIIYANEVEVKKVCTTLPSKIRETEYISLDELPCNENKSQTSPTSSNNNVTNSLDRRKRQGARVTLDADGKVVYSSDSLRRKKGAHTTFEPGPFVKVDENISISQSPLPIHRTTNDKIGDTFIPPPSGKLIIKAGSGSEVVRIPPTTIVVPNERPMSPKPGSRGAYVHMHATGRPLSPTQEKERVRSPYSSPVYASIDTQVVDQFDGRVMYNYSDSALQNQSQRRDLLEEHQYYFQKGSPMYQTLPSKRSQFYYIETPERSVTPDITRGLERSRNDSIRKVMKECYYEGQNFANQKLGIPVRIPDISPSIKVPFTSQLVPGSCIAPNYTFSHISPHKSNENDDFIKMSPIDPRNSAGFQSSTPSSNKPEMKAAVNLENKLMSPKKSTMSSEELYSVIHKSKKKMNIVTDEISTSPVNMNSNNAVKTPKSLETGYIGDNKSRCRLSWSPSKGEYVDFNSDIDTLSPLNDSRSRQSWACNDRKGSQQTSRLDFKKLLLQKNTALTGQTKKLSAVEQLKISKQQLKDQNTTKSTAQTQPVLSILDLSSSPRSFGNRKLMNVNQNSPSAQDKTKPPSKLMSPKSQWRFTNPRTDVLSSTILEDCREDESPNSSLEKQSQKSSENINPNNKISTNRNEKQQTNKVQVSSSLQDKMPYLPASQRLQARRAQLFKKETFSQPSTASQVYPSQFGSQKKNEKCSPVLPTLETAF